jgi:hypothetical protein
LLGAAVYNQGDLGHHVNKVLELTLSDEKVPELDQYQPQIQWKKERDLISHLPHQTLVHLHLQVHQFHWVQEPLATKSL